AKPLYENTELEEEEDEGKRGSIVSPRKRARFGGQCVFPGMAMTGVTKWEWLLQGRSLPRPFSDSARENKETSSTTTIRPIMRPKLSAPTPSRIIQGLLALP